MDCFSLHKFLLLLEVGPSCQEKNLKNSIVKETLLNLFDVFDNMRKKSQKSLISLIQKMFKSIQIRFELLLVYISLEPANNFR